MTAFDVIALGRIGVDLYPEQIGVGLEDVRTFRKMLGGSPTNVAVAAARLGHRTAIVTKVGDDAFGRYARRAVEALGVDPRFVGVHPGLRTPLAFCEVHPPDEFPLLFYREPSAPDMHLARADLDLDAICAARILWTTGTGLSAEPSRAATLAALANRPRGATAIHDLDHRPMLWRAGQDAGQWGRKALGMASVAVGNAAEAAAVVGPGAPLDLARRLLRLGPELAIVKLGPDGVLAATREAHWFVPPVPVDVVCGLGAGDAFGGALCHGLLEGWDPEACVRYANAAGAIVASRLGCADDMPTGDEVQALLDRGSPALAEVP